ncbi:MAG TPA: BlaI/MecI/CopY family transcriptional regulator, partial [Longimicrobium sp.]|nr:BlaI/MecI/CopY family transcriptional regulator [Longimicrobium sp.]
MPGTPPLDLGRRERQIMEVVYRLGRASASEVRAQLPDPPSYSAVRGMLRLLEEKGHLRHAQDGIRHVYSPTVPQDDIRETTMRHVLRTF